MKCQNCNNEIINNKFLCENCNYINLDNNSNIKTEREKKLLKISIILFILGIIGLIISPYFIESHYDIDYNKGTYYDKILYGYDTNGKPLYYSGYKGGSTKVEEIVDNDTAVTITVLSTILIIISGIIYIPLELNDGKKKINNINIECDSEEYKETKEKTRKISKKIIIEIIILILVILIISIL